MKKCNADIGVITICSARINESRGSFAEWEIALEAPAGKRLEVSAFAEDVGRHVEMSPHKIYVD